MRLLIVEDERAIAEVMMLNLKRVGYECEYAQDGEMGVAMVEKQSYDLVLLDIMLPKINGSGDDYGNSLKTLEQLFNANHFEKCATKVKEIYERGKISMNYYQYF